MISLLIGLVVAYLIRYFAFYLAMKRTGWVFIDKKGLGTVAFISLILGVVIPAGAFDFVGILLRLLIISVFIVILFGEDFGEAFGASLLAAVVEVVLGLVLVFIVPSLGINPFAVP